MTESEFVTQLLPQIVRSAKDHVKLLSDEELKSFIQTVDKKYLFSSVEDMAGVAYFHEAIPKLEEANAEIDFWGDLYNKYDFSSIWHSIFTTYIFDRMERLNNPELTQMDLDKI